MADVVMKDALPLVGDKQSEVESAGSVEVTGDARVSQKYLQLTKLPTLQEIKYEDSETSMDKLLAKSVALQLKLMNKDTVITKFAFTRLMSLVEEQLSDMVNQMNKLSTLQRRKAVAKNDVELFLRGFNLNPSDLDLIIQQSDYIKDTFKKEYTALNSFAGNTKEILNSRKKSDKTLRDDSTIETLKLVPITNPLKNIIPEWLPKFPPDYTYKFTPQYNSFTTDETVIRKKVAEEGKKSEKALLHLLESEKILTSKLLKLDQLTKEDMIVTALEGEALYGGQDISNRKNRTPFFNNEADEGYNNSLNSHFDILTYVHERIGVARNKVKQYEDRQIRLQNDPFLKMTSFISEQTENKVTKSVINNGVEKMLKRSFLQLINNIPSLNERRKKTREEALVEKEKKHSEWLKRREEKLKQLEEEKRKKAQSFGLVDLASFSNSGEDGFLDGLDSSDNEQELEIRTKSSPIKVVHASSTTTQSTVASTIKIKNNDDVITTSTTQTSEDIKTIDSNITAEVQESYQANTNLVEETRIEKVNAETDITSKEESTNETINESKSSFVASSDTTNTIKITTTTQESIELTEEAHANGKQLEIQ